MKETEAHELASVFADALSEALSGWAPQNYLGAVGIVLNDAGVAHPNGKAVVQQLRRILQGPHTATRPNDFQSKLETPRPSIGLVLGGRESVTLHAWTEVEDQHPHLIYELVAEGGAEVTVGRFRL